MDKIHKPPQLNESLQEKLYQLTKEFGIASVFHHPPTPLALAQIVIVAFKNKDVAEIESRKWIRNSIQNHETIFHVIHHSKMEFLYRKGNPFFAHYCHSKSLIYQNPGSGHLVETDWKSFKKKFHTFTEQFYHDHDILFSEVGNMGKYEVNIGRILLLKSVYEHDLDYLEELYFGKNYSNLNLHQRINRLSKVLPIIESLFVKENAMEYYLLKEFDNAIEHTENEELYFNDGMLAELIKNENKLYNLISERFSELKRLIRSQNKPNNELILNPSPKTELSKITTKIISMKQVEEIYLFDKKQNPKGFTYYFLLVGNGLGTELLNRIQESVSSGIDNCTVVLIGHSRIWIQKENFIHQAFFQKVMTAENKVYESHEFHPALHWESSYTPQYHDINYYFRSAKNASENYFLLRKKLKRKNTEGLEDLFYQSIMRIFRTYIFSKSTYLPNFLHPFSLWKLCLYFEPGLEKLEFLFEKLNGEKFFNKMHHHLGFHHDHSVISKDKLKIMDEILHLLIEELEVLIKAIS